MEHPCVHYEVISPPEVGKHIIGVCRKCGKITDYTELQQMYPILSNSYFFSREDLSMERIMASFNGGKKRKRGKAQSPLPE